MHWKILLKLINVPGGLAAIPSQHCWETFSAWKTVHSSSRARDPCPPSTTTSRSGSELVSQHLHPAHLTNDLTLLVVEKSRDHKSKGVGSITLPSLYIIKEDGDPSLKLWAQTLLVEDRADQGESIVQWISKLREKVRIV